MRKCFVAVALLVASFSGPHSSTQELIPVTQIDAQSDGEPLAAESTGSWFVELASAPTADGSSVATLEAEEAAFHAAAAAAAIPYQEERHFRRLWNGLSVSASDADALRLRGVAGVRAVYPVLRVRIQQEPSETVPELITALAQTGADTAQNALGLTGAGVRVAVMDTGVDYHHPDLGGCFGPGCRVERGFDFVGDAYDSSSATSVRVSDPFPDDCNGHGTHVAGIVGANGTLKGVAPGVTFHAYRVFGCSGTTSADIMLEAMERALADGSDILNMSIGAAFQWPQDPTAVAADRAVKEGMVVVASIGNSGASGLYSASAPGNGNRVIGVASFDNTHQNVVAFSVSPDGRLVGYQPATAAPKPPLTGSAPMARTGTPASTADACNGATAPAPGSLAGRVALIRRGTCGFYEKSFNAQAAGAIGVVLYNNVAGSISATVAGTPPITIPVVTIQAADGVLINDRIAAGPVTMTWTNTVVSQPLATAGLISSFSSWGLPPDLSLKPDLGAPGGNIRSTIPLEQGAFGPNSGTSMAAPHVAGAAALLLQARPGLAPGHVSALLQNNADPRRWFGNPALGFLDNAHRQGGGMLDIVGAIRSRATTSPSKLALGEIESGTVTREVTVGLLDSPFAEGDWASKEGVTFTLGHEPALSTGANTFTPSFLSSSGSVSFSTPTITVGGAQAVKASFNVTITPPVNANARIFGGYITLTPNNGSGVLRVPYAGYNGDYQAITTLVPTANNFPWLARQTGPTTYTNQPTGASYSMVGTDVPVVVVHLDHAATRLIFDVYDVATGRYRGRAPEEKFLPRNSGATTFFAIPWDGTLGGAPVANGTYRIEMSVLKALGDRNNPAHTERWTSPNIVIARP